MTDHEKVRQALALGLTSYEAMQLETGLSYKRVKEAMADAELLAMLYDNKRQARIRAASFVIEPVKQFIRKGWNTSKVCEMAGVDRREYYRATYAMKELLP